MRKTFMGALLVAGFLAGCDCAGPGINPSGRDGSVGGGSGGGGGGGNGGGGGGAADGGDDAGFTGCGLVTCASAGASCGPIGDGCGAVLNCGSCTAPTTCGGGGVLSQCGGTAGCVPKVCDDVSANCGPVGDGCGGLLNCGSCTPPETCGGGGSGSRCGQLGTNVAADGGCVPTTCAASGAECGAMGDGCGGALTCGTCSGGKSCGAGGIPYVCGGGYTCTPRACPAGACGALGDGCGGILNCPTTCAAPETCGGGGVANRCGGGAGCVPRTLDQVLPDGGCGLVGDGCGALLDAGVATCPAPLVCGGGGVPNRCGGAVACVPKTCLQLGKNCGPIGDGCGGLIASCGACTAPNICGGAGIPSVCGSVVPDGGVACTNLCTKQVTCPSGTTTMTGTVLAPTDATLGYGSPDPIPGALVYVPNATVLPFPSDAGVTCDQCASGVTGSPLVSTYSAVDGKFTLSNVPCGQGVDVPVVIQLGKWRRQITVPSPTCCANTALTATQTRLPRRQAEGHPNDNIPLIAVVTGDVDIIECVLPKIGIDSATQFSLPSGSGRVRFYKDNGANFGSGAPAATVLFNSLAELKKYDMVIIDCVGKAELKTTAQRANLEAYAAAGGRVFTSHYGYVWLYKLATNASGNQVDAPNSFTGTATWTRTGIENSQVAPDQDAFIDTSFAKGQTFATWVQTVGAQSTNSTAAVPRIPIRTVRWDMNAVIPPAQRWVYGAPSCTRASCSQLGYTCGRDLYSGCAAPEFNLDCGGCPSGRTCGGGGVAGQCGRDVPVCVPKTCAGLGFQCGRFSNGCGGVIDCGTCATGTYCGAGGSPGLCAPSTLAPFQYTFNTPTSAPAAQQCGRVLLSDFHVIDVRNAKAKTWPSQCFGGPMTPQEKVFEYLIFDLSSCIQPDVPPPQSCTPRTCQSLGYNCGPQADGCGGQLSCGTCAPPQTCGGGGTPGVCGGTTCVPKTCQQQGFNCGAQGDGCGGQLSCGPCTLPQTCGGGGTPGICGSGGCVTQSCQQQGFTCGLQGDGCGGQQNCGSCVAPLVCGGSGVPGVCGGGGTCTPRTCQAQGFTCGLQGDGCGGAIDCGDCSTSELCGAVGPGICGTVTCTPLTCAAQSLSCGPAGDGCGNLIQCGSCPTGQTCGGGGVSGVCGAASCSPRTCASAGADCGALSDGCGGLLECGTCVSPRTCGGGGTPNVCGGIG